MKLEEKYAHGLFEAQRFGKTPHQILAAARKILDSRGHQKLLPRIFAEYEKLERRAAAAAARVIIAREEDRVSALGKARELFAEGDRFELCVDPRLLSGYVVRGGSFLYDASARRALVELYNKLTTNN